jgi:drug/metabolite transporter (DMT)-like permease
MTSRGAALFIVVAGTAFATSGPLARLARPAHPFTIALGRVALASLALVLLERHGLRRAFQRLPPRQLLSVAGAGALLALHFALFIAGLDATSLPAAVSLVSLEPLSVVLFAWIFHGIAPDRLERLGVLAATGGAFLVGGGAGIGDHRLAGDLLVVGAVVVYGLYIATARALRQALPSRVYAAAVYGFAAIALLPLVGIVAVLGSPLPLPPRSLVAIALLALLPTLVGHTAVQTAARSASPSLVALVSPAETVGALAISAAVMQAPPSHFELAGAAVILVGVALAIASQRRKEAVY